MAIARQQLISLETTPYYHCMARCVRQAFLCGVNGDRNYEHRRQWVEEAIFRCSKVFAIDICAYAIMHNHYHLVVHINSSQWVQWDDREVIKRWHMLFKGHVLSQRFLSGLVLSSAEQEALKQLIAVWRERLLSVSWFIY